LKAPYPKVALKRLSLDCQDLFERERAVLNCLRCLNEPRIIPLLASYKWREDFYLMLPFADYTLEALWQRSEPSDLGPLVKPWALRQITGLAECLAHMHHFPSALAQEANLVSNGGRPAVGALHGDISPQNILVMQHPNSTSTTSLMEPSPQQPGTLVFSDFGLSTLFYNKPPDQESTQLCGNCTFEAPERRLGMYLGRASDIWSFGGVVLEFLVWLILGREVLEAFFEERCTVYAPSGGKVKTDSFYELVVDEEGKAVGAGIKDIVVRYMELVRKNVRCGEAVIQMLDVVTEGMLVVDTKRRYTAQKVADIFRDITTVNDWE
jgi:serine/threonine protein kinase